MGMLLLRAALWRRRGTVALALFAVAIGASVASALLHVSGDIGHKLSRELRVLGPNLLIVPAARTAGDGAGGAMTGALGATLDEADARARLGRAGIDGVPLLYVVARAHDTPIQVVGADLDAARRLHPAWKLAPGAAPTFMGERLEKRLGVRAGERLEVRFGDGTVRTWTVGASLAAGGPDDDAWWVPLADAQELSGLTGKLSLVQARVVGGEREASAAKAAIERGGGAEALVLRALSATEAGLLTRMHRLMLFVTLAALLAAGLCAFGTLADLALERRREIALMKALGAGRRRIVGQLVAESLVIGLLGGALGWLMGLGFAELIAGQVFHAVLGMRWSVPPIVMGLALLVAAVAGLGPIRLALAIEPAAALKGE
jgi:putative ABC transport system permease protein